MCPFSDRRQPIILTDSEVEKIDKESPGSYKQIVKFGSDKDKKYSYICPRYWDIKRNISLTEEQVKSGKYGNIIPEKATVIPEGANIYEFKSKKHVDKDGKYIDYVPGFLGKNKHPKDKCMACCFHNERWSQPAQSKRREECLQDNNEENTNKNLLKKPKSIFLTSFKSASKIVIHSNKVNTDSYQYKFIIFYKLKAISVNYNYDNKLITNTNAATLLFEISTKNSYQTWLGSYWNK